MDKVERFSGESRDIYELKCKNFTDIKTIRAKKSFDRKPYYLIAKEKQNGKRKTD